MKFFTRAWCQGERSDEDWGKIIPAYQQHIETITPFLSHNLNQFVKECNLHDGLIQQVQIHRGKAQLQLAFICGDLQQGYFDLTINYNDVHFAGFDQNQLVCILQHPQSELLYDELDLGDKNRFVQRMIFYPVGELAITFSDLSYSMKARANRRVDAKQKRLIEWP